MGMWSAHRLGSTLTETVTGSRGLTRTLQGCVAPMLLLFCVSTVRMHVRLSQRLTCSSSLFDQCKQGKSFLYLFLYKQDNSCVNTPRPPPLTYCNNTRSIRMGNSASWLSTENSQAQRGESRAGFHQTGSDSKGEHFGIVTARTSTFFRAACMHACATHVTERVDLFQKYLTVVPTSSFDVIFFHATLHACDSLD